MAADTNGRPVEPGQKGMNGHAKAAKAPTAPRVQTPKKKSGFNIFSFVSRILTWFAIYTVFFRCPQAADLLTPESSFICKPYFQVRSFVAPHLEPYYNTYAAPYVESARPYYETLDRRIISPATAVGKKYGAPRVAQAQAFGQAQWDKSFQPQVQKYQKVVTDQYRQTLGPHVDKAIAATSPYYDLAKTNALQTYYETILPTYTTVQPYVVQGYGVANDFAVNTAYPFSKWAWTTGAVFLDRTVWPKVRILYGENVEPQLVRIGQRLGRYRDGKKIKAVVEVYDSSSSASSASKSVSSLSPSIASAHSTPPPTSTNTETTATSGPSAIPESEKEVREKAQKVVAHDLKEWQEKFSKAADEGSDDLDERITEITERLISSQAEKVGKAHIIQLEETIKSSLNDLKSSIISIVKSGPQSEEREEEVTAAVRKAGVAIKEKALEVRTWGQSYDMETNTLVSKAAQDTFEILDIIRDSGLQEVGMRWAWTDGVTHKDWAKYHKLKTKFDEWRFDVEQVATGHPGLEKARAASEEVVNQAMAIAQETAKELSRLKETGMWKLTAGDASDEWSTHYVPAKAAGVAQKVKDKASELSESVMPTSQGAVESIVSVASSSIVEAASQASSIAASQVENAKSVASSPQGSAESAASVVKESVSSVATQASSSVIGTSQGSAESIASVAKAFASSVVDQASSSIIGTSQGTVESIVSVASESASSPSAEASSSIIRTEPGVAEKATDSVISVASEASETASSALSSATSVVSSAASQIPSSAGSAAAALKSAASKKVFAGAMAQDVEARQIIFEDIIEDSDDETFSEKLQSMASQAGDRYSDITKAVSEALLKTTTADSPAITKIAADQYSRALSAASVALYGTEQGTSEIISSVVSSRYVDAVAAASAIIYGTPTPLVKSVAAQATSAYLAAMGQASENYEKAKSIVSAQYSGKPKPVHEEMYSSVEAAYSDSVAAANTRLQSALSAASTAIYGTSTPVYQSVFSSLSSVAQSKLSEGLSAASERWEASKTYVAAIKTDAPRKQQLLIQMQGQYYAGIGMAHARYSEFMDAASSAVIPRETPVYESVYSKASAGLVGTTTHKFQAALNTAEAYYSSAISGASSQLDELIASVSSAAGGQQDYVASVAAMASSKYNEAVSSASQSYLSIQSVIASKLEYAASEASATVIGSETPWTESVASAASDNWEALITKASQQIYGAPTPYMITRRLISEAAEYGTQVTSYAAQATEAAASQYIVIQSIISELVIGKEPAFTESVYNRLSSAYYTGAAAAASSASSYASEAYESASSVVGAIFTPPPQIESILTSASNNINFAIEAVQNAASEQLYGTTTGYYEAAQSSISAAAADAQKAISEAVYGTQTGTFESITSVAGEAYASATAAVSGALHGEEKGAVESANSRLFAAVESARGKLAEYAATFGEGAAEVVKQASEAVEGAADQVSSAVNAATTSHDEL